MGDLGRDIADVSPGAGTALAAWLAVVVAIAAGFYVHRQVEQAKQHSTALTRPNVAMFIEPSAQDWHLVELLRGILTYYQYATKETREEVIRGEINRINAAIDETRERYRNQFAETIDGFAHDDAETMLINGRHRRDLV